MLKYFVFDYNVDEGLIIDDSIKSGKTFNYSLKLNQYKVIHELICSFGVNNFLNLFIQR